MTKPTSADGQINNKNKQISRSEPSLQGWTNEFGAEIWVENAGKTKWRMKSCSSSSPLVSTAPSDTFGWCLTAIGASCILNFQLNFMSAFSFPFFPSSEVPKYLLEAWSQTQLDKDTGNVALRWGEVKCKNPVLDTFFIIWFEENRKEKGKTYDFVLNLGVVNMTCTSSCTRVYETLLYPIPNKLRIHRWAVVSISIFLSRK